MDDFDDDFDDDAWHLTSDDEFSAEEYDEFVEREFGASPRAGGAAGWVQATAIVLLIGVLLTLVVAW